MSRASMISLGLAPLRRARMRYCLKPGSVWTATLVMTEIRSRVRVSRWSPAFLRNLK